MLQRIDRRELIQTYITLTSSLPFERVGGGNTLLTLIERKLARAIAMMGTLLIEAEMKIKKWSFGLTREDAEEYAKKSRLLKKIFDADEETAYWRLDAYLGKVNECIDRIIELLRVEGYEATAIIGKREIRDKVEIVLNRIILTRHHPEDPKRDMHDLVGIPFLLYFSPSQGRFTIKFPLTKLDYERAHEVKEALNMNLPVYLTVVRLGIAYLGLPIPLIGDIWKRQAITSLDIGGLKGDAFSACLEGVREAITREKLIKCEYRIYEARPALATIIDVFTVEIDRQNRLIKLKQALEEAIEKKIGKPEILKDGRAVIAPPLQYTTIPTYIFLLEECPCEKLYNNQQKTAEILIQAKKVLKVFVPDELLKNIEQQEQKTKIKIEVKGKEDLETHCREEFITCRHDIDRIYRNVTNKLKTLEKPTNYVAIYHCDWQLSADFTFDKDNPVYVPACRLIVLERRGDKPYSGLTPTAHAIIEQACVSLAERLIKSRKTAATTITKLRTTLRLIRKPLNHIDIELYTRHLRQLIDQILKIPITNDTTKLPPIAIPTKIHEDNRHTIIYGLYTHTELAATREKAHLKAYLPDGTQILDLEYTAPRHPGEAPLFTTYTTLDDLTDRVKRALDRANKHALKENMTASIINKYNYAPTKNPTMLLKKMKTWLKQEARTRNRLTEVEKVEIENAQGLTIDLTRTKLPHSQTYRVPLYTHLLLNATQETLNNIEKLPGTTTLAEQNPTQIDILTELAPALTATATVQPTALTMDRQNRHIKIRVLGYGNTTQKITELAETLDTDKIILLRPIRHEIDQDREHGIKRTYTKILIQIWEKQEKPHITAEKTIKIKTITPPVLTEKENIVKTYMTLRLPLDTPLTEDPLPLYFIIRKTLIEPLPLGDLLATTLIRGITIKTIIQPIHTKT